jgi:hypothetical protein
MIIAPSEILVKMSDEQLRAHLLQAALLSFEPDTAISVAESLFKSLRP